MDESESKAQELKKERRFDPELKEKGLRCDLDQYEMLKRCSDKKNMTEWNDWRKSHKKEDVFLEGKDFSQWFLRSANLGVLQMTDAGGKLFGEVYLKGAIFEEADLKKADLQFAHLEGANLCWAHLEHAGLMDARLNGARMWFAHLEGADLAQAHLQGVEAMRARVDGGTEIWEPRVNRYRRDNGYTNLEGVALHSARIDSGTKQLLEYNIRRKNWEEWYKSHRVLKWPVRWFWSLSDYGLSTLRIVFWFFGLAVVFAGIYGYWAYSSPPGIVSDLMVEPHLPAWHYFALLLLRPFYFSVVTMTTLGFGDMYADAESIWGHILLTIQVILGYVLLGALVTRFAVLFTAGGPAEEFADEKEED